MTVDIVTAIELGDVLAIRYKCGKCGVATSVPIDVEHSVPGKCGTCHQPWFPSTGDPRQNAIYEAIVALRHARRVVAEFSQQKVPCSVRLEIDQTKRLGA